MNKQSYEAMKAACENFVNKVETGKARSKESYKEMKEALLIGKFGLSDVSQHREQLLAYHKHMDSIGDFTVYNVSEDLLNDYIANNCG